MNFSTEKSQLCCQLKAHLRFDKVFAYIFCKYYPISTLFVFVEGVRR